MRQFQIGLLIIIAGLLAGCPDPSQQTLRRGYDALEAKEYQEAITRADEYLQQKPTGPGSAEALYLRGRGYEEKTAANPNEAAANLQAARAAYVDALKMGPPKLLEAYVRTSLANVAYFQDDFPVALQQWTNAYESLDRDDVRAWVLYRIGLSQQRLGQFDSADRTFGKVQQTFPDTTPAVRSREHVGLRAFYVQVGVYSSASSADKASARIRQAGAVPARFVDTRNRQVVRAGPFSSYADARAIRGRLLGAFPDAIIVP